MAPGQGDSLAGLLSSSDSSDENGEPDEALTAVIEAFKWCLSDRSKTAILSMVPSEKFSKEEIMKAFICTKYQVDKARKFRDAYGPDGEIPKAPETKQKLDLNKAQHFLDFYTHYGMALSVRPSVRSYVRSVVHNHCGQDIARTVWPRMLKLSVYT